jgi:transposase
LDTLVLPVVTTEAMSIFLAEVGQRHPEEFILMFLDGAGWHRANNLMVPENMRLEALPPYSPQLNPVEHIWDEIREKWKQVLFSWDFPPAAGSINQPCVLIGGHCPPAEGR